MAETNKFYWLKLKRDFFKRHDIRIIEEMENGKDYILFYLKLLLESISHEGQLRFSETIPYNEKMLSVITNTNIDIVRSAMKILAELKMIEILDDSTIYMSEVLKLTGSETASAQRKRLQRAKSHNSIQYLESGTMSGQCPIEIEKEIELEKEKELELINESNKSSGMTDGIPNGYQMDTQYSIGKDSIEIGEDIYVSDKPKRTRFVPPTLEEVQAYCKERNNNVDAEHFINYYTSNGWQVGRNKMKDWKAAIRTWEKNGYSKPKEEPKEDTSKWAGTVY